MRVSVRTCAMNQHWCQAECLYQLTVCVYHNQSFVTVLTLAGFLTSRTVPSIHEGLHNYLSNNLILNLLKSKPDLSELHSVGHLYRDVL